MRSALLGLLCGVFGASCLCVGVVDPLDDAGVDAGVADSSVSDSGVASEDAGHDAGLVDAGAHDAGIVEPVLTVDAGTWVELSWPAFPRVPAFFREPEVTDDAGVVMTSHVPWREFSRAVMYDGGLYYFGGGHSGYPGNDIMRFDTATTTWRQLYRPHVPPADDSTYYSGGSQRVHIDPVSRRWEPYVVHNYARTTYLPGRGYATMIRCPSASELSSGVSGQSEQPFGLAIYDEASNTWSCDGRADDNSVVVNTGEYDPVLGGLFGFGSRYETTYLSVYRDDAGWVGRSTVAIPFAPHGISGQQSLYVPPLRGHLVFSMPQAGTPPPAVYFFDSTTLAVSAVTMPAALMRDVGHEGAIAAAYDSARGDVVLFVKWNDGTRVWVSPAASRNFDFKLENDRGPTFASAGAPNRTAVHYDSKTNAFYDIQAGAADETANRWPRIRMWKYTR